MNRFSLISNHLKNPVFKVSVTGAAGQIAYAFIPSLCRGVVLGSDQTIELRLLDIPQALPLLDGLVMELNDCAYPLLSSITVTSDPKVAFQDADLIVFFGGFPRKQGMERKELISKNTNIFKVQGEALNEVGKPTTKCVVVANPANTNCLALATYAPKIPRENFTCLTRLDQNRAYSQIAGKLKAPVSLLKNIIIWGNHSPTQYPDVSHGLYDKTPIKEAVKDEKWITSEFLTKVQQRGSEIIKARKQSSVMSAASATIDHIRDWAFGTGDSYASMGVLSDGSYDIPKDIVFSFPVKCHNWTWTIVQGLVLDKYSLDKICTTTRELFEEKKDGLSTN
jgi:malate dehydrogenase